MPGIVFTLLWTLVAYAAFVLPQLTEVSAGFGLVLSFALGSRFLHRVHLKICRKYKKQVHHLSIKNFGFREKVLHLLFFM